MDSGSSSKKIIGPALWLLARIWLGGIFALAGFLKLMQPVENFQAVIQGYVALPPMMVQGIARVFPWLEWLGGMLLMVGYGTRAVAALLVLLTTTFLGVLTKSVVRGEWANTCGCLGGDSFGFSLNVLQAYALDWFNLLVGLALFFKKKHPLSLDGRWGH